MVTIEAMPLACAEFAPNIDLGRLRLQSDTPTCARSPYAARLYLTFPYQITFERVPWKPCLAPRQKCNHYRSGDVEIAIRHCYICSGALTGNCTWLNAYWVMYPLSIQAYCNLTLDVLGYLAMRKCIPGSMQSASPIIDKGKWLLG